MIDIIKDRYGNIRRLGSTVPPTIVSSFHCPVFEDEHPVWPEADIKEVISDPSRKLGRRWFDSSWIMNQGSYGSCNGFAGSSALAKIRFLRGLNKLLLSGAYLYSKINGNRDQGSILEDGLKAVELYGVAPASLVTPDMIYANLQPKNADDEARKHKGFKCYAAKTKEGWRTGLAAGFMGIAAVHVGSNFDTLRNGIAGIDGGKGNHAVCIDDLILVNGKELYDMPNSWGTKFGDQGRAYLTWDHFSYTFQYHVFYLIASSEESE